MGEDHADHEHSSEQKSDHDASQSSDEEHENHNEEEHKSHGDEDHGEEKLKSKTILGVEHGGRRFKLSKKAISTLKLKYRSCVQLNSNKVQIPNESLVSFGNEYGVYLHSSDWFELIEVQIESRVKENVIVSADYFSEKNKPCEIVVSGVPLLRVAQLEASGEGGEGHAH